MEKYFQFFLFFFLNGELKFIYIFLPASFCETCQWLKFPLNGLRAQSRVSAAVGLLPLASGPPCLGIRETGTGQQVAQLHDRYMMTMMINY